MGTDVFGAPSSLQVLIETISAADGEFSHFPESLADNRTLGEGITICDEKKLSALISGGRVRDHLDLAGTKTALLSFTKMNPLSIAASVAAYVMKSSRKLNPAIKENQIASLLAGKVGSGEEAWAFFAALVGHNEKVLRTMPQSDILATIMACINMIENVQGTAIFQSHRRPPNS